MRGDVVEIIREQAILSEVIGEKIAIQRRGRNITALCPFHPDTRPSLQISDQKGIFKCFSCQMGGDVFKFLMEYEKISFKEAVSVLAARYKLPLPERWSQDPLEKAEEDPHRGVKALHAFALKVYHEYLLHHRQATAARAYLSERGIRLRAIKAFQIGFAPRHGNILGRLLQTTALRERFSASTLAASNLFHPPDLAHKQSSAQENAAAAATFAVGADFFSNRILFPIRNEKQEVLGFGGRACDDHPAKYINSRESDHFHKHRLLYGFHESYQKMVQYKEVFLVEGYFDVLGMHAIGLPALAPMGTAVTVEQLRLLKKYVRRVHFLFDGDAAGKKASLHGSALAAALEMDGTVYALPAGSDPFDFIHAQKGALVPIRAYLAKHHLNLYTHLIRGGMERRASSSPVEQKEALERLMPVYVAMQDTAIKNAFKHTIIETFKMNPEEILRSKRFPSILTSYASSPLRQSGGSTVAKVPRQEVIPRRNSSPKPLAQGIAHGGQLEEDLVLLCARHPKLLVRAASLLFPKDFSSKRAKYIYSKILHLKDDPHPQHTHVLDLFKDPEHRTYLIKQLEVRDEKGNTLLPHGLTSEEQISWQFNELLGRLKLQRCRDFSLVTHKKTEVLDRAAPSEDKDPLLREKQEETLANNYQKNNIQEYLSQDQPFNTSTTAYHQS